MKRKRDPSVFYLDGLDQAKDAELGGIGLDWDLVPAGLARTRQGIRELEAPDADEEWS